ncbi:MAG: sulfotransferase family protein [Bacteroidota bacterium]
MSNLQGDNIKRIFLWSGPRNISTALMYSFAQRPDAKVFDEPFYAYYLRHSNALSYHPGAKQVLSTMENDGQKVLKMVQEYNAFPVLFFKNMSHHIFDIDLAFTKQLTNVILTRNPKQMLLSYDKVIKNPTLKDVGYKAHLDLVNYFEENGIDYIVIDSSSILKNPNNSLRLLCSSIEIPFFDSMLTWPKGGIKEDGVWAKFWYKNVHNSEGFQKYKSSNKVLPEHLVPLYEEAKPYYDALMKKAHIWE